MSGISDMQLSTPHINPCEPISRPIGIEVYRVQLVFNRKDTQVSEILDLLLGRRERLGGMMLLLRA